MDLSSINAVSAALGRSGGATAAAPLTGVLAEKETKADGTLFDAILHSAMDNIRTTNAYLSDQENEEIKFALGQTENTHDLTIAMNKASTALQYTIAVRDKFLDAYKEIMQMQI
ncbi:MAG: flagellar hook-basal body complex protein FliE [Clostridium sp.]|jgi:flagellar hook-basal body complex protein FliE|nr:flagellar hook-basal body complex protein FliE [Clostridium sp.]